MSGPNAEPAAPQARGQPELQDELLKTIPLLGLDKIRVGLDRPHAGRDGRRCGGVTRTISRGTVHSLIATATRDADLDNCACGKIRAGQCDRHRAGGVGSEPFDFHLNCEISVSAPILFMQYPG